VKQPFDIQSESVKEGDPLKLQFNNNTELFFPDFGIFKPKQVVEVNDELIAKKMLSTGYFEEVKKEKPIKIKIKKSKKKKEVF